MPAKNYFTLNWKITVPAGGTKTSIVQNVLREIYPDRPFKIHKIVVAIDQGADVRSAVTFGRNVTGVGTAQDPPTLSAGCLGRLYFNKGEINTKVLDPPQPIEIDKDDSFNVQLYGANTGSSDEDLYAFITLYVEV